MNNGKINVTVWNEYWHEQSEERIRKVYPEGIHAAVAAALNDLSVAALLENNFTRLGFPSLVFLL